MHSSYSTLKTKVLDQRTPRKIHWKSKEEDVLRPQLVSEIKWSKYIGQALPKSFHVHSGNWYSHIYERLTVSNNCLIELWEQNQRIKVPHEDYIPCRKKCTWHPVRLGMAQSIFNASPWKVWICYMKKWFMGPTYPRRDSIPFWKNVRCIPVFLISDSLGHPKLIGLQEKYRCCWIGVSQKLFIRYWKQNECCWPVLLF